MYEGLTTFQIGKLFSFNFYSYGFGFFFLNLLATAPFIASDNIEMSIYIPRIVTALFAVGSLWYIYKIALVYLDKYSSILISLVVLTMPGFWKNAFWFHPDWMMTFFIVLSVYFFAKDNWSFKKFFWWSSISLGLSLSTKVQAITFFPFVFIYVFYDNIKYRNLKYVVFRVKLLVKYISAAVAVFIITNPYLLHPAGLKAFIGTFVQNMNSNATNHGMDVKVSIGNKITNAIDFYYLDTFLFIVFIIGSLYLISSIFVKKNKKSIMPIVSVYFLINIIYLFLMVNKNWQHYYLTVFTVVPLILIPFIVRFSNYKYVVVGSLIILQIITHISEYSSIVSIGYHPEQEISEEKKIEISDVLVKDLKGVVSQNSNILISAFQPFDFRVLGLDYRKIQVIYGPLSKEMFDVNSFLEKSNSKDKSKFLQIDFIVLSKKDIYFDKEKLKARVDKEEYRKAQQLIKNFNNSGDLGYEKFSENKYFYIWRKKQ
jgi:4-amino-4-deoxy-L-arabinose transferase-like glycosyltransferase